jgi:hypothetical protein
MADPKLMKMTQRLMRLILVIISVVAAQSPSAVAATKISAVDRQLQSTAWTLVSLPNGVVMDRPLTLTFRPPEPLPKNYRNVPSTIGKSLGYAGSLCKGFQFTYVVKGGAMTTSRLPSNLLPCPIGTAFVRSVLARSLLGTVSFRVSKHELIFETSQGLLRYVPASKWTAPVLEAIPRPNPVGALSIADVQGTWKQQSIVIDSGSRLFWPIDETVLSASDTILTLSHPFGLVSWTVNSDFIKQVEIESTYRSPEEAFPWHTKILAGWGPVIDPKRSGLLADGRLLIANEAYEMIWERV